MAFCLNNLLIRLSNFLWVGTIYNFVWTKIFYLFFHEFERFINWFERIFFVRKKLLFVRMISLIRPKVFFFYFFERFFYLFEQIFYLFERFNNLSERPTEEIFLLYGLYTPPYATALHNPDYFFFKIVIMLQSYYSRHSDLSRFKWFEFLTFRINKCAIPYLQRLYYSILFLS